MMKIIMYIMMKIMIMTDTVIQYRISIRTVQCRVSKKISKDTISRLVTMRCYLTRTNTP